MKLINFKEENIIFTTPKTESGDVVEGFEDCGNLPACRTRTTDGVPVIISCLEFTDAEIAELAKGKRLYVHLFANHVTPLGFSVTNPFVQEEKSDAK